jgi:predicted TIM-barrel fold metal-dependent hydrolase
MTHSNFSYDESGLCYLCDSNGESRKLKIIDAHTHLYLDSDINISKFSSNASSLLREMEICGVEKALVISIAPLMDQGRIAREVKDNQDRLCFAGSVDPWSTNALESIDYVVNSLGAKAIKLHPRLQGFGYENLDLIMPIARYCGEIGVPIILCTFCGGQSLFKSQPVELVYELAIRNPKTIIVMAHAGAHRPLDALLVQKACPNVYLEISFSPLYFEKSSVEIDFRYILNKCDSKKIIYGSDYPEKSLSESLEWVLNTSSILKITNEDLENIFYKNAMQVYKIK